MDEYEELERIGKGAEGTVFLVRHRRTQQTLVMKKIFLRSSRASSMQEAKILSQLTHSHIVRYHDSFLDAKEEHLCIIQVQIFLISCAPRSAGVSMRSLEAYVTCVASIMNVDMVDLDQ